MESVSLNSVQYLILSVLSCAISSALRCPGTAAFVGLVDQDSGLIACLWQSHLYPFSATLPHRLALVLSQASSELKIIHSLCWLMNKISHRATIVLIWAV